MRTLKKSEITTLKTGDESSKARGAVETSNCHILSSTEAQKAFLDIRNVVTTVLT